MNLFDQMSKKMRSVWRLPLTEKLWLLMLYPYSGLVRLVILMLPFRLCSRGLGQHYYNYQLSSVVSEPQLTKACRIGRLVDLVARYTPWKSKCLVQAIMAITLLKLSSTPYVLYLGVKTPRGMMGPMKAHAWVRVGSKTIIGQRGHQTFHIVSSFVTPSVLN